MSRMLLGKFVALVIDDEPQIRRLLRYTLDDAGYVVREAADGRSGLDEAARQTPDVVIMDLGLPDLPGTAVLRQLRRSSDVPVLLLSACVDEHSKIAGLDAGADDFLAKPFREGELLARLRALLRRTRRDAVDTFVFGDVVADFTHRRVTRSGQTVKLTPTEYALLQLFVAHHEQVLTHQQIFAALWGAEAELQMSFLRTYMLRLRRKLEDDPDQPQFFQTESGIGYRFVSAPLETVAPLAATQQMVG